MFCEWFWRGPCVCLRKLKPQKWPCFCTKRWSEQAEKQAPPLFAEKSTKITLHHLISINTASVLSSPTTLAEVTLFGARRLPNWHIKIDYCQTKIALHLHLCCPWLCACRALGHTKTTYFITQTYSINQFLQALNACDSITNQQIDTTLLWCCYLVLSIMQQHLSAEAQSIADLLSGAVTTSILHMSLSCSPVSQQQLQLSLVVCKAIW